MSIDFIRPEVDELRPRISVIGVGGAGGNAIANMIRRDVQGVEFLVANTDAQALNASAADRRIQLGLKITQGLGAGSRPEIGRAAAEETLKEAFEMADEVLQQGVRGITDLMVMPGLINLDFADVRSVMGEMGKAMMGTGEASGDNRAIEAAEKAISNPLLDGVSMKGAKGVIISITGGEDMRLMEVDEAASHIKELVDPDANIIWGSAFNNDLGGKIRVSVVATGIEADVSNMPEPAKTFSFPARSRTEVRIPGSEAPVAPPAPAAEPTLDLAEPATPAPTIED